jgi:hypothetical protein
MISQASVLAFLVAAFPCRLAWYTTTQVEILVGIPEHPDPENRRARMSLAGLRRKGLARSRTDGDHVVFWRATRKGVAAAKRKAAL